MQMITGQSVADHDKGAVAALGNFDGVHRGHQHVLHHACRLARRRGAPAAAIVFEPHPRRYFQPEAPPFRLQSSGQRARALAEQGLDRLYELPFDAAMAGRSAENFIAEVLGRQLGLAGLVVGADFRFGKGRGGDITTLQWLAPDLGFVAEAAPLLADEGQKVSSSVIRTALLEGRVQDAGNLLGRPWAIEGVVQAGAQRGRTIGFPTANVGLGAYQRPAFGVYAVRVRCAPAADWRPGVANLGLRPTVQGGASEPLLEAHLFDFEGDLYGRLLEVALVAFIRPERRFEDFAALRAQIAADAATARGLLADR